MSISQSIFRYISSVLILTNVIGNSLVILVILKSRSMKTPINYLLLNLAVADVMVGVFVVPKFILDKAFTHPQGKSGDFLCKFLTAGNLAWASTFASVFSLVLIAFDRYCAIMKPLSTRHRITTKKLKIFIPICWITVVVLVVPHVYFGHFDEKEDICGDDWPNLVHKLYDIFRFLLAGILPTGIMMVLYGRVIHRLWFGSSDTNNATLQGVRRSRKKITKTMLMLSVIYVFCWFPDPVMHGLKTFFPDHVQYSDQLHNVFNSLIVLNSTVNPVVYAFRFGEFRKGLRKIFCCKRKRRRMHRYPRHNSAAAKRRVDMEME